MQAQPSEEKYQELFGTYHRKDGDVRLLRKLYIEQMIAKLRESNTNVIYLNDLHDRVEYLLGFPMVPDVFELRNQLREARES